MLSVQVTYQSMHYWNQAPWMFLNTHLTPPEHWWHYYTPLKRLFPLHEMEMKHQDMRLWLPTVFIENRQVQGPAQAMLPAFEAILGQRSAHSFATGPVMAEPADTDEGSRVTLLPTRHASLKNMKSGTWCCCAQNYNTIFMEKEGKTVNCFKHCCLWLYCAGLKCLITDWDFSATVCRCHLTHSEEINIPFYDNSHSHWADNASAFWRGKCVPIHLPPVSALR